MRYTHISHAIEHYADHNFHMEGCNGRRCLAFVMYSYVHDCMIVILC